MLEVKTVSYTRKINAEIAFSLEPSKNENKDFTISMGDGSSFCGKLYTQKGLRAPYTQYNVNDVYFCCQFDQVQDVNTLSGELAIYGEKEHRILKYNAFVDIKDIKNRLESESIDVSKLPSKTIEGKITITFEPSDEKMFEKNLTDYFGILTFKPGTTTQPKDIKLVVQEQEFEFNRACLAKISSVFEEMFENCASMEGSLPIPDEKIQTFQTFKRILDGNSIGAQDITMDLFKFADKFNIQPLVKACGDYFAKNINKENMFKLAIIANRVEDGHLKKKLATLFVSMTNNAATKAFSQNNPQCFLKLMQSMFE